MNGQYGDFTNNITALDRAQLEARAKWADDTAQSFDCMNDNVKDCVLNIWRVFSESHSAAEAVKLNYPADEFDDVIAKIAALIEQV